MSRENKAMIYRKYATAVGEAVETLAKIRNKELTPIKTKRPWLDNHFPLLPQSVITIGAGSGIGKTFELMKLMEDIFDKENNPDSDDFVWLNISLEMKIFSLLLRTLSSRTKKTKKDLLFEDLSDEEIDKLGDIIGKVQSDERIFLAQEPTSPTKFKNGCKNFLEEHKDKRAVFISLDHLALMGSDSGEARTQVIEHTMEFVNDMKLEYPNVIFILLSQLNSERKKRMIERSNLAFPQDLDLYYSQFSFQISDYVYVMINPFKDKLAEYGSFYGNRYEHLEQYFLEEDKNGKTSLETIGVMYYHLLKCRDADDVDYIDIYARELNIKGVEELRERRNKDLKPEASKAFKDAVKKNAKEEKVKTFDIKPRALDVKNLPPADKIFKTKSPFKK